MAVALSIGFFLLMMCSIVALGCWFWIRETPRVTTTGPPQPEIRFAEPPPRLELPHWLRGLADLGSFVPGSEVATEQLRRDLAAAGFRRASSIATFRGLKVAAALGVPMVPTAFLYAWGADRFWLAPVFLSMVALGFRIPNRLLTRSLKKRRISINRALPDFLDLLLVAVESGLALEQAVADTARDLRLVHPVLSEELAVFQFEVQAGTSRTNALRNLGRRCQEPEMRKLTSLLVQADRFGTSVSGVLRTQARYMRIRRRQKAEESAHKVAVKLIFPIFLLIMPTMFLVTAGPAVFFLMINLGMLTH